MSDDLELAFAALAILNAPDSARREVLRVLTSVETRDSAGDFGCAVADAVGLPPAIVAAFIRQFRRLGWLEVAWPVVSLTPVGEAFLGVCPTAEGRGSDRSPPVVRRPAGAPSAREAER